MRTQIRVQVRMILLKGGLYQHSTA
jgi:hypothetical protein